MSSDFNAVTKTLGERYREWKHAEKGKNESKEQFFELVTEKVKAEERPTSVIEIRAATEEEARAKMAQYHPTLFVHGVVEVEGEEHIFQFIVEEDPEYAPYTHVNPEDGMVYTRQVAAGKLQLDDDLLKEADPELYERVTEVPQERVLRPLEDLDPEDLAAVQEYIYEGKPTVKLGAPRKAKQEELEDG